MHLSLRNSLKSEIKIRRGICWLIYPLKKMEQFLCGCSSCEATEVRTVAVSNFQVKMENLVFVFPFLKTDAGGRGILLGKVMRYVEVTHINVCSCVTSLPRSGLNWSWLNNYLKIACITNLLFVNQIISVTLNWHLKTIGYNILSCLQLLISLFVWLVSERFLRLTPRFAELQRHDLSLKMNSHFCFI